VLFAAGFAMAVLAVCYWLVDVRGWKLWAQPFIWFGVNPLAIYALASWLGKASVTHKIGSFTLKGLLYDNAFAHLTGNPYINSLAFATSYVLLFWVVAWLLYRRRIFVRV
jgi:predicted acyltransferase